MLMLAIIFLNVFLHWLLKAMYLLVPFVVVLSFHCGDVDKSAANGKLHKVCNIMAYCSAALNSFQRFLCISPPPPPPTAAAVVLYAIDALVYSFGD